MSQDITEHNGVTVTPMAATDPMLAMIERAARDPAVDVDKLERLLQMQAGLENRRSRMAYTRALAAMQADFPVIGKTTPGDRDKWRYAPWEAIVPALAGHLSAHGFSLSFRIGQFEKAVTVTGILAHVEGAVEETTITLPVDTSGSKNAVQAVGSSVSYGKRYVAGALLNFVTASEGDDDGRTAGLTAPTVDEEMQTKLAAEITRVGADYGRFMRFLRVERLADLPAHRYAEAMAALKQKGARS